jgi:RNA polymerase sigma-70 factor (ECF subfamily)
MIQVLTPAGAATPADGSDHLDLLVGRVAAGDKGAFRCLYAFLAMRVWCAAVATLPDRVHAPAVTRSTFVELWHLARHHTNRSHANRSHASTRAWIAAITARQIDDRLRTVNAPGPLFDEYDRHVHRELADLLGAGQATIRVSPATFARVDDLDLALATIAAA